MLHNTNNLPELSASTVVLSAELEECELWARDNARDELYMPAVRANDLFQPAFYRVCELARRFGARDEVSRVHERAAADFRRRLARLTTSGAANLVRARLRQGRELGLADQAVAA